MALSDLVIQRIGRENISNRSKLGGLIKQRGVVKSNDFHRVASLPRRRWEDLDIETLRQELLADLRLPGAVMDLWDVQTIALAEIRDWNGGFLPISVGRGKALISLLASVVLKAKRPVLFVPAALREQTKRHVIPEMSKHWRLHPNLRIIGYSEISLAKNAEMLERLEPDVIIMDEAHSVKNLTAGRTKRFVRFMRDHPQTKVVAMSGTISNRSLQDYWHIIRWCLKDDMVPLPAKWREVKDWADAIDEKVDQRLPPGALLDFCTDEDRSEDLLASARKGYRRRLTETPGVIATGEEELGTSLRIHRVAPQMPRHLRAHLNHLETNWETPNGDIVTEAIDIWRHARELAVGFYYEWDPKPPKGWMQARKAWKKFVREKLKRNRQKLDTELQVWTRMAKLHRDGHFAEDGIAEFVDWKGVKDQFTPVTVARWESDYMLAFAAEWLRVHKGIVWTEHQAFGVALSEYSGVRFFGPGKQSSIDILNYQGPMIASRPSHGEGKNLQDWNQNLVVAPPSSGKAFEQLIGRTHRAGQLADEVHVHVFLNAESLKASLKQAISDAKYLEQTTGMRQKLGFADFEFEL